LRLKKRPVLVPLAIGALAVVFAAIAELASVPASRVTAWATVFEVGVLLVAALFAGNQLAEMRQTRIAQTRPYVIAYLRHQPVGHTLIEFVIANAGKTVARDITVTFVPPLSPTSGPGVSFKDAHWVVFESGLPMLAPGQELTCLWAHSITIFNTGADIPKRHEVKVSYRGDYPKGSSYNDEEYVLDVGAFYGRLSVAEKGAEEIAQALEDIGDSLKVWTERDGVRVYIEGLLTHRERIDHEIQELIERHNAQTEPPANPRSE
jgi:hypothetical protein